MTKHIILAIAISGSLISLSGCAVDGYVETPPADVVYTRPVAPGPDYIWIDGDWVWSGGAYTWRQGYWHRGRPGRSWQSGSWSRTSRGYHWNRGHWH